MILDIIIYLYVFYLISILSLSLLQKYNKVNFNHFHIAIGLYNINHYVFVVTIRVTHCIKPFTRYKLKRASMRKFKNLLYYKL